MEITLLIKLKKRCGSSEEKINEEMGTWWLMFKKISRCRYVLRYTVCCKNNKLADDGSEKSVVYRFGFIFLFFFTMFI